MERRGSNTWLVAVLAIAVGFLAALLIFGGDDSPNTSATVANGTTVATQPDAATGSTTASQPADPAQDQVPTTASCINLWNLPANRGPQTFLINTASQQPVRVNVGVTTSVPPECLVTIVANNGDVYTYPEGGGTTYPYATTSGRTTSKELSADQKTSNALEQRDGTLSPR